MQPTAAPNGPEADLVARNMILARKRGDISQLELARRTGMKRYQLYEYEHALVVPGVRNLRRIAFALGVSVEWLVTEHGDEEG